MCLGISVIPSSLELGQDNTVNKISHTGIKHVVFDFKMLTVFRREALDSGCSF